MDLDPNVLLILLVVTVPTTVAVTLAAFFRALRRLNATLVRLEAQLDRMERADGVVATNLADRTARADRTRGPEGAAADAASQSGRRR